MSQILSHYFSFLDYPYPHLFSFSGSRKCQKIIIKVGMNEESVNHALNGSHMAVESAEGNVSVNFIRNNFQIFGFGCSKQALFQTIKELVDNSIDATKKGMSPHGNIRVEIMRCMDGSLEVRVTDNGIGFSDPQRLLSAFQSTAISSEVLTAGRYGLGLSTLFLYSYSNCSKPIRIITKTNEDENVFIGDYIIDDQTGNPLIVQSMAATTSLTCGSSITIPIRWNSHDGSLVEELSLINMFLTVYITRLQLLPQSVGLIHLLINIDELQVDRIFETEFTETVHQKFQDCSKYGYSNGSTVMCIEEVNGEASNDISVQMAAILISSCGEDCDDQDVDPNEEQYIPVKLLRYVNGIPLLDSSDTNDYKECGITKAFTSLHWKEYGKKVSGVDTVQSGSHFSKTHFKLSTIYDPCQYNFSANNCDRRMELIFLVNVSSRNSLYTSLCKAAIVNQSELTNYIADGLHAMMDAIKHNCSIAFMNPKEWKTNQLNTRLIPSLSRSVARSINLIYNNPSIPESGDAQLSNTLTALGINPNDPTSSIVAVISRLIDSSIGADQEESIGREDCESADSDEQDWSRQNNDV